MHSLIEKGATAQLTFDDRAELIVTHGFDLRDPTCLTSVALLDAEDRREKDSQLTPFARLVLYNTKQMFPILSRT